MTDVTRIFSALSDPTRLRFVEHLIAHGERPVSDLTALTQVSAPAVSRHLKVLREAGLLERRVAGTHRYYRVSPAAMATLDGWLAEHRAFWAGSLDRLDEMLAEDPKGTCDD